MREIIQDYGMTVGPKRYMRALQGHQYIPQADQGIRDLVHAYGVVRKPENIRILDVGCGPGRLTFDFAHPNASVYGVDTSESFIRYADIQKLTRERTLPGEVWFQQMDFTVDPFAPHMIGGGSQGNKWHVLVAQGVLHHIHGDDRILFIERCRNIMRDDGIVIVGDEVIPNYNSMEQRRLYVAAFYLHIIAEASKGDFRELVEEEARNFIDDVLSGERGCGYADRALITKIELAALHINQYFFVGVHGRKQKSLEPRLEDLINQVRVEAEALADKEMNTRLDRGDHKVSIQVLVEEFANHGLLIQEKRLIGPVETLGGMGVLVFKKG